MCGTVVRGKLMVFLLAAVASVGCDSATGSKDPKIGLSLSSSTATISQGGEAAVLVIVQRTNFTSPVTLTVDGLPQGVTATFTPASPLPDGTGSSSLSIVAAKSATPGNVTLTVRASGEGVTEQTATIALTVNVTGNYSLSPLNASVTVAQGGGGIATIVIARTGGNAGNVSLTVSGAPAGVTASFGSTSTTDRGISLSLSASPSTATGTSTLTITGTSPGLSDQTTMLSVVVIPPPSTANLTIPFCSSNTPVWFAYQNEGYQWQQVTPTGNSFSFAATQKVGVAFVFQTGLETDADIYYATRAELGANNDSECRGANTVLGSTSVLTTGQSVSVALGSADTTVNPPASTYTLRRVAAKALDLVATRGSSGTSPQGTFFTPDRMIIRRSLNQADGSTIPPLDFSAEGFTPDASTLTISGVLSGELIYVQNYLWSPTYTFGLIQTAWPPTGSATLHSVPAAQLVAGDLHELYVDAYTATSTSIVGHAYIAYPQVVGNRADAMGPILNGPALSVLASSPYVRMRGQLVAQPEYTSSARFAFIQGPRTVLVGVTAAHLGGTPGTWEAAVPDFTGTAGFNTSWMLAPGSTNTVFQVDAFSGRTDFLFGAPPAVNDLVKIAYRLGYTSTALRLPALAQALYRPRVQYFRR